VKADVIGVLQEFDGAKPEPMPSQEYENFLALLKSCRYREQDILGKMVSSTPNFVTKSSRRFFKADRGSDEPFSVDINFSN
jgi:hypothetical protein